MADTGSQMFGQFTKVYSFCYQKASDIREHLLQLSVGFLGVRLLLLAVMPACRLPTSEKVQSRMMSGILRQLARFQETLFNVSFAHNMHCIVVE